MKFARSLLALAISIAGGTFTVAGLAADTTIKCNCDCKDAVGTWKASCYSTSDCTVCCSYRKIALTEDARKGVVPVLVETGKGKLEVSSARKADARK